MEKVRGATPTGLMFHHFHDGAPAPKHPAGQGSISAEVFDRILSAFRGRLLSAGDWLARFRAGTLEGRHVCVTFDDSLLCQYDIARPVLEAHGLAAFWFVYTSVLEGGVDRLEIYRHFRNSRFKGVEAFYAAFFALLRARDPERFDRERAGFVPADYLPNSPFYTDNDRFFRYLRDHVLIDGAYDGLMAEMMRRAGFAPEAEAAGLWLDETRIRALAEAGHVIGLHSHSHPTTMGRLPVETQRREYEANHAALFRVTGHAPETVSHPCNSYGPETLDVLAGLGIVMGFRADVAPVAARGPLEFPREDHANLIAHLAPAE